MMNEKKTEKRIIVVCSAADGRRRGGIMHPPGRTAYAAGVLTDSQLQAVRDDAARPNSVFSVFEENGVSESTDIDTAEAAEAAALDLLRPFLKVPEQEARTAISELLHGGPAELPPVVEPVVDWPLHPAAAVAPPPDGAEETTRRPRRPRGGQ